MLRMAILKQGSVELLDTQLCLCEILVVTFRSELTYAEREEMACCSI